MCVPSVSVSLSAACWRSEAACWWTASVSARLVRSARRPVLLDPLEPQPHDPDVKALLRMAVVWNIPIACNRSSADFLISSPLMDEDYDRIIPDYDQYRRRRVSSLEKEDSTD